MRLGLIAGLLATVVAAGCGHHDQVSAADTQACGLVATDAATGLAGIEMSLKAGSAAEAATAATQAGTKLEDDVASLDAKDPVRSATYTLAATFKASASDFTAGSGAAGIKAITGQAANQAYESACRPVG